MRYLTITYIRKPDGKIDEQVEIVKNLKERDITTANIILDFKEQKVLLCSVAGISANKDWDTIVSYYYKHYSATIERLFQENGHELPKIADPQQT
jgi:hypothetical protein